LSEKEGEEKEVISVRFFLEHQDYNVNHRGDMGQKELSKTKEIPEYGIRLLNDEVILLGRAEAPK